MASAISRKFINEIKNIETEYIEGLMETYPGLQFLNGFPKVKVVFRADVYPGPPYNKVAVISGGGSGHEPAHAGFVGEGMLTAAICGNLFECPTVDAILAGIRTVTGPMGCLLIVMNYERDRLNFGLAAEQAKYEGYQVETVIVGDDCALPQPLGLTGRRGLAGTILVHKVAGAAAAAGLSLADVAEEARYASENVGTVGVAIKAHTLPTSVKLVQWEDLLKLPHIVGGMMELGHGINGEKGLDMDGILPADKLVSCLMKKMLSKEGTNLVPITRGDRVVLMVNGLGGTPLSELMIATGNAVPRLIVDHGLAVDRVYTGSFMTSLNMEGLSISLMKVDEPSMSILQRLDAETKAPYWPIGVSGDRIQAKIPEKTPPSPAIIIQPHNRPLEQGELLEAAIVSAAKALILSRDLLDGWDIKVGDGDCGSNMWSGALAILEDMKYYPLNDAAETVRAIGLTLRKAMRGTNGIIYLIFCTAACVSLKTSSNSGVISKQWTEALGAAIAAVSKYGRARAGERTMLDALIPALSLLEEKLNSGDDPLTAFLLSAEVALQAADSTKHMQATAERTPVRPEDFSVVPDPGAMAAATWYKAAAMGLKEKFDELQVKRALESVFGIRTSC